MNVQKQLLDALDKQLMTEIDAQRVYRGFLKKIDNKEITGHIKKIIIDEIEHIAIVEDMIKIVKEYQKPVKELKATGKKGKELKNILEGGNSILVLCNIEGYTDKILMFLKKLTEQKKHIIYISYNKIPKYIKKLIEERKIDLGDITFINCSGGEDAEAINIRPEALTELSLAITGLADRFKNIAIIVDTISAFSIYNSIEIISKFIASISNSARKRNFIVLWMNNNPEDKIFNSKIANLCDSVVNL